VVTKLTGIIRLDTENLSFQDLKRIVEGDPSDRSTAEEPDINTSILPRGKTGRLDWQSVRQVVGGGTLITIAGHLDQFGVHQYHLTWLLRWWRRLNEELPVADALLHAEMPRINYYLSWNGESVRVVSYRRERRNPGRSKRPMSTAA